MSYVRDKFNTEQKSSIFLLVIRVPVSSERKVMCELYEQQRP